MSKLEELIKEFCPNGVEYKKIKECYNRLKGTPITAGKMKEIESSVGNVTIFAGGKTVVVAKEQDIPNANIIRVPAVVVQSRGIIDVIYCNSPFTFKNEMWAYSSKEETSVKYLFYYLKSKIQLLRDSAAGMGALPQISLSATEELQIPLPALPVQREIVRILDSFTLYSAELIAKLTAELTARRKQYEFYRDKLLMPKSSTYQTEWKELKDVCRLVTGATPSTSKKEYWENGTIPWMSSGEVNNKRIFYTEEKITELGYQSSSTTLVPIHSVVIALAGQGKTRGKVAITEIELCTNQSLCSLICGTSMNYKFLYYYLDGKYEELRAISNGDGTRGGLSLRLLAPYKIPVPPMEVQERIVKVLDNFDAICSDLGIGLPAEIEKRQKQYEYYREKLLTFDGKYATILTERNGTERAGLIRLLQYVYGFAFVRLGDICSISSGRNTERLNDGEYPVYGSTGIIAKTNIYKFDCEQILIARVGANAGYVYKAYGKYDVSDNTLILSVNSQYNANFIFYNLINMRLNRFAKGGGQPLITAGQIKELLIPLPTLEKQKEIVEILDKFDSLCNDLTAGLPAEIEHRQKQYEYYRDKLLQFRMQNAEGRMGDCYEK